LDWRQPVRIVLDQNSRLQKRAMYLTIKSKLLFLLKRQLIPTKKTFTVIDFEKNIATQMTDALYDHQSVIIEGGRQTLQTFIDANLWMKHAFLEELYTSKKARSPNTKRFLWTKNTIGQDELIISRNHD
jgi:diaminohydroxyphosphoribosylaminopyrimidine deaminase/5-amino-6-(5-phosphoribosylamino)uracil reductase